VAQLSDRCFGRQAFFFSVFIFWSSLANQIWKKQFLGTYWPEISLLFCDRTSDSDVLRKGEISQKKEKCQVFSPNPGWAQLFHFAQYTKFGQDFVQTKEKM
jgi:hypothetical protein